MIANVRQHGLGAPCARTQMAGGQATVMSMPADLMVTPNAIRAHWETVGSITEPEQRALQGTWGPSRPRDGAGTKGVVLIN